MDFGTSKQYRGSGDGREAKWGVKDPFIGLCIIDYYDIGIVHVCEESDEPSNVSVPDTSPSFCGIDSLLSVHLSFNLVKATLISANMVISGDAKGQPEGPLVKELKDTSLSKDSNSWIDGALIEKLKNSLKGSPVLTSNSDGYKEAIKRWSDAVERQAVSIEFEKF